MGRKPSKVPLEKQISYDPETGYLYRRADVKYDSHGYKVVSVNGQEYRAHRLAWYLTHGYWPPEDIDHVNRVRDDNRLVNLRCATRAENLLNRGPCKPRRSIATGVYYSKVSGRWFARLKVGMCDYRHLGLHSTRELATECHQFAQELLHG